MLFDFINNHDARDVVGTEFVSQLSFVQVQFRQIRIAVSGIRKSVFSMSILK
jgi:hypothetical protein